MCLCLFVEKLSTAREKEQRLSRHSNAFAAKQSITAWGKSAFSIAAGLVKTNKQTKNPDKTAFSSTQNSELELFRNYCLLVFQAVAVIIYFLFVLCACKYFREIDRKQEIMLFVKTDFQKFDLLLADTEKNCWS